MNTFVLPLENLVTPKACLSVVTCVKVFLRRPELHEPLMITPCTAIVKGKHRSCNPLSEQVLQPSPLSAAPHSCRRMCPYPIRAAPHHATSPASAAHPAKPVPLTSSPISYLGPYPYLIPTSPTPPTSTAMAFSTWPFLPPIGSPEPPGTSKLSETSRKAQNSLLFNILATWRAFAVLIILSHFFASYRGIRSAKRYKTVVTLSQYSAKK